jgi:hypothetical protein
MIKDVWFNERTDTIGRPCRFFLISTTARKPATCRLATPPFAD